MTTDKNICEKCNSENTIGSKFCNQCGTTLDEATTDVVYEIEQETSVDEINIIDYKVEKKKVVAGRYEIIEEVGRGGMGIVYKAFDKKLERFIALKTLKFDEGEGVRLNSMRENLVSEAKAVAKLKHPNIVGVYDVGTEGLSTFVAMELISGTTLSPIIKQKERPELDLVVDIISQLCDGVSHAYERGIIHRDLKPGNIMLENSKDVKITDFGIAKVIQDQDTTLGEKGRVIGTPSYMAPERFDGVQDDFRSDIFAIGVILYELIAGVKPFRGKSQSDVIYKINYEKHEPLRNIKPDLPDFINIIIDKALEKNPTNRYQSADELKSELVNSFKEHTGEIFSEKEIEQIVNIPFHKNRNFTGREEVLSRIDQELKSENILAIHAMGGMGKSQTATEFAYRNADDYTIIWWIHSEDPSTLSSGFASLAEPLGLPFKGMKEQEVIDIVKGWLEREDKWLLVFDNAENPDNIRDYFPKSEKGHILITSRNPNWGSVATTLSLD